MVNDNLKQVYLDKAPKIVSFVINKNLTALKYFDSKADMYQILMLGVWNAMPSFDVKRGKFTTFVVKCCYNIILLQIRAAKAKKRNSQIISLDQPTKDDLRVIDIIGSEVDYCEEIINKTLLDEIVPMLDKETYLYYIEQKTQREIAALEHKTQSCVCRKIKKNILRIRQFYEQNTKAM